MSRQPAPMIPESVKPDCADCAKRGSSYDMLCRGCVGRWLTFLRTLTLGERMFQDWCKAAARQTSRDTVLAFLRERGVPGYVA